MKGLTLAVQIVALVGLSSASPVAQGDPNNPVVVSINVAGKTLQLQME
jgi:hypothetical protein